MRFAAAPLRSAIRVATLGLLLFAQSCGDGPTDRTVDVSLEPGELFERVMAGGDEEGAQIVVQASHFAVSEIRHDASTNFTAVYRYQPADGFVGQDEVVVEASSGSDGASAPTRVTRFTLRFHVSD